MRQILFLFILFLPFTLSAQNQIQVDSLVNEICRTVVANSNAADSSRIAIAFARHLYPFLANFPEHQREDIGMKFFFRLQRNCPDFKEILDRESPPSGDWAISETRPESQLTKKDCRRALDKKYFKYLEASGDTVRLTIENGYWVDNFKDGTYSKLKLRWISDCEFEIEFIESNNRIRKDLSKPGDKYVYQILEKNKTSYDMSVKIPGVDRYMIFKLHYEVN